MTFLPNGFRDQCYFPEQVEMLRSVYLTIAAEPWFVKDIEKQNEFAARILKMYNRGLVIRDKLYAVCYLMARRQFAESLEKHSRREQSLKACSEMEAGSMELRREKVDLRAIS